LVGGHPFSVFSPRAEVESRTGAASIFVFVETVQPHDSESSQKGNADDTPDEALASDNFFFTRVFFGRFFGLSFIAEELIVRADEEQMVGVCSVVDGQVVGDI
jgi:hypothetical protein